MMRRRGETDDGFVPAWRWKCEERPMLMCIGLSMWSCGVLCSPLFWYISYIVG